MLLLILGISLVTYASAITYVGWNMAQKSIADAKKLADLGAREKANRIQSDFEGYLSLSRAMAMMIQDYPELPPDQRFEQERRLLAKVLKSNPDLKQVWLSWDLKAIWPQWSKDHGRERHAFTRLPNGSSREFSDSTDLRSYDPDNFYYQLRALQEEGAAEPYHFAPNAWPGLLGTSIVSPVLKKGNYLGQVGFDFATSRYMSTTTFEAFDRSYAIIISDKGKVVAHPDQNLVNEYIDQISFIQKRDPRVLKEQLSNGMAWTFEDQDQFTNEKVYVNLQQVPIGQSRMFWTVGTVVPFSEITYAALVIIRNTVLIGLAGLALLILAIVFITNNMVRSLKKSEHLLNRLVRGEVDPKAQISIEGSDELSRISQAVNDLLLELSKKAAFAEEIGRGNLESDFTASGSGDQLGISLLQMRQNLLNVIKEVNHVVSIAAEDGNLSERITADEKQGVWKDLATSINDLLASFYLPFQAISSLTQMMAQGDLSDRLDETLKGDIGKLSLNLNQGLQNLTLLLANVIERVNEIQSSASEMFHTGKEMNVSTAEIAQSIEEMNNGATSQVEQTDQSSQLIEKIMRSSTGMEDQAQEINNAALASTEKSEQGLDRIERVNLSMQDIASFSEKTNQSFQVLSNRSRDIAQALEVITEIASQTNLLALNAAIEAAQAGDAGRGFAVVADEIRKLAEDSRRSAGNISQLVEEVQNDTKEASQVLEVMNGRIKAGEHASQQASEAFQEITSATDQTLQLAQNIYEASLSQKLDIQAIVGITESVVVIAEETAAGTEEISSSASQLAAGMNQYQLQTQDMEETSRQLKEAIEQFKLKETLVKPKVGELSSKEL